MSLQSKILLILLVVISLYVVFDYASQYFIVLPSFISIEHSEARNTAQRCIVALKKEVHRLDMLTKDLATTNDVRQLVEGRDNHSIDSRLVRESFSKNNLDVVYLCNSKGQAVWTKFRDPETKQLIEADKFPTLSLLMLHPSAEHQTAEGSVAGIVLTEQGPMIVAARPIFENENAPVFSGSLIAGKFLYDNALETIAEQTPAELKIWALAGDTIPAEAKDVLKNIKAESQFQIRRFSNQVLHVYTTIPDIQAVPALLVRVTIPRDIRARGIAGLIRSGFISNLTSGISVLLILMLLLHKTVVRPVKQLTSHVVAIGNSDDLAARLTMRRRDEIGTLAREFNRMVERLAEARKRLFGQSYHMGIVETTTGVLHNVRNALTPIVSRIDGLHRKLAKAPVETIEIARTKLLEEHCSDQQKKDLNMFIDLANKSLAVLVDETKEKLADIQGNVLKTAKMLLQQDNISRTELFTDKIKLDKLLKDAIGLLPDNIHETVSIEIDPDIYMMEPVKTYWVALLQVFNNILINAAESINRAGVTDGKIRIKERTHEVDGIDMVHVQISDNGEGIEPGNLEHIFERGFSTKTNAPSGIGLHWCANTIAKIEGQIYAESNGSRLGACIHVLFPVSLKASSAVNHKFEVKL